MARNGLTEPRGRDGTWQCILQALQAEADARGDIDWDGAALDATHIKAHRASAGARTAPAKAAKKGALTEEWIGHSRGGCTTKIHLGVDGKLRWRR